MKNLTIKKTYITKSNLTSGNTYRITMSKDNKTIWFLFHDNYMNESTNDDLLDALLQDASCYESYPNLFDFLLAFGYGDYELAEGKKAYYGCKKQYKRMRKLFTTKELEELF